MFQTRRTTTGFAAAIAIADLIYHAIVRYVRQAHSNALMSIVMNIFQTVMFVGVFYFMFSVLGLRGIALRGDFLVYIMSGVFLFMTHIKAIGAVYGSEGPSAPMMKHAPMTTAIAIASAAFGSLYIQVLSMVLILFAYHVVAGPLVIDDPIGAMSMVLLAWFTGAAIGMLFLALKPWFPTFTGIVATLYQRVNMIASGKMFVANTLPSYMLAMFDWNPLFHCIDQSRGFAFINYFPRNSEILYPLFVGLTAMIIGLMGEFYTRRRTSVSWGARR